MSIKQTAYNNLMECPANEQSHYENILRNVYAMDKPAPMKESPMHTIISDLDLDEIDTGLVKQKVAYYMNLGWEFTRALEISVTEVMGKMY